MDEKKLARTLNSVGKECFVRFFGDFYSNRLSREELIEKLAIETEYTPGSCISRVGHAMRIVREGCSANALKIIIEANSKLISAETKASASRWLSVVEER